MNAPDHQLLERHQVESARRAVHGHARETPILESDLLNRELGARLLVKAECLQKTGSFKYRAAFHRLSVLTPEQRRRGVVAYSSGNFGSGLAAAGAELDVPVTVVAPADAPRSKLDRVAAYGAALSIIEPKGRNRERVAAEQAEALARASDATLLHPFEDALVLASHAALVLETLDQALALAGRVDVVFVPCGGGGLAAATCWAVAARGLHSRVVAVEPSTAACVSASLRQGERVTLESSSSLCDALCAPTPGRLAFQLLRGCLHEAVCVDDHAVPAAVNELAAEFKLVVEPSGALGLAAAFAASARLTDLVIATIATGGNAPTETKGIRDAPC